MGSPKDKISNIQICKDEINALVDLAKTCHTLTSERTLILLKQFGIVLTSISGILRMESTG